MVLVETHIIDNGHGFYRACDDLCLWSKNLYNASVYAIRQQYELDKTYLNYQILSKKFSDVNNPDYRKLPAKVSQQIMMVVDRSYKSYFKAQKSFLRNPSKFNSAPQSPKFKHKTNGRNVLVYTVQALSTKEFKKTGCIALSGTNIKVSTQIKDFSLIQQARIVPMKNDCYKIEILYNKQEEPIREDNGSYCGIDIGLNNLFAVAFNDKSNQNILVKGTPLKGINQYYNKKRAKIQGDLAKTTIDKKTGKAKKTSNKLNKLTKKRNNKINDYVHKSTKKLVDELKQTNVCKVVIGKNDGWKDEINIGSKNNQNFVSLPHARAIDVLKYKLEMAGIEVVIREEAHTSKTSCIDLEPICHHDKYVGTRVKRGLFKSKDGLLANADINGAANILRKEIPDAFADGIEGIVVCPCVLHITKRLN